MSEPERHALISRQSTPRKGLTSVFPYRTTISGSLVTIPVKLHDVAPAEAPLRFRAYREHALIIEEPAGLLTNRAYDEAGTGLGVLDSKGKAEVDGVPVPVIDQWVKDAIKALRDPTRRDEVLAEEEQERKRLPDAIRDALDEEDELDDEDDQDELDE